MKRRKSDSTLRREKLRANIFHLIITFAIVFLVTTTISYRNTYSRDDYSDDDDDVISQLRKEKNVRKERRMIEKELPLLSSIRFDGSNVNTTGEYGHPVYLNSVVEAFQTGTRLWQENNETGKPAIEPVRADTECPENVSGIGPGSARLVELPCGLKLGSQVVFVGTPRKAWPELKKGKYKMMSQFSVELRGLRAVDGEDPPRIFHLNPRVKGDWSRDPVIEMNTCYRMQWGKGIRCDGYKSNGRDGTVDGLAKCERWLSDENKVIRWLKKLTGLTNHDNGNWTFPLKEGQMFALTIRAGLEGYHVGIDGRHISSFPYHQGFSLEDATGLSIEGDVDVHSIYVAPLPTSRPNDEPERLLEMFSKRTAHHPLVDGSGEMFVGIISVGNHFAERMAIRNTWMQHRLIKSSKVLVRFFIAVHSKKNVNEMVKKEAQFYGDIVIVPYMDKYNLIVLKTIAIVEYGVNVVNANYIMKCDDDTFVRIEAISDKIKKMPENRSFYLGKINYKHKVMRSGKWAVTHEEYPEDRYPSYADGPGYILTSDIAKFIVSQYNEHKLRLFSMEDVTMGMWVEQFKSSKSVSVQYIHDDKFSQSGCVENYKIAHYQSPKQMICLWNKLLKDERPQCCDS